MEKAFSARFEQADSVRRATRVLMPMLERVCALHEAVADGGSGNASVLPSALCAGPLADACFIDTCVL